MTDYSLLKITGLAIMLLGAFIIAWLPAGWLIRRKTKLGRAKAWSDETEHWRAYGSASVPVIDADLFRQQNGMKTSEQSEREWLDRSRNVANDPGHLSRMAAQCQAAPAMTKEQEMAYVRSAVGFQWPDGIASNVLPEWAFDPQRIIRRQFHVPDDRPAKALAEIEEISKRFAPRGIQLDHQAILLVIGQFRAKGLVPLIRVSEAYLNDSAEASGIDKKYLDLERSQLLGCHVLVDYALVGAQWRLDRVIAEAESQSKGALLNGK